MPSQKRRLPVDPASPAFDRHAELVRIAARLADYVYFDDLASYRTEIEFLNKELSRAEVGFVLGYIACANAPPDEVPLGAVAAVSS
jgi:hypothetical protein